MILKLIVLLAFALFHSGAAFAFEHKDQSFRLSQEVLDALEVGVDTPFLMLGQTLEERLELRGIEAVRRYQIPVQRFPSHQSCLSPEGNFRWGRFRSVQDVEVCVFRISSKLKDARLIADFLVSIGFKEPTQIESPEVAMRLYGVSGKGLVLSTSITPKNYPFTLLVGNRWPFDLAYAFRTGVRISEEGQVLSVNAGFSVN